MKNILKSIGLLSIMTTMSSASLFGALSYGQSTTDQILNDEENQLIFQKNQLLKLKFGTVYFPSEKNEKIFGAYMGVGRGVSDSISYQFENNEETFQQGSWLLNVGLTTAINNNIAFFGGIGIVHSAAEVITGEATGSTTHFSENNFNANGGVMVYFGEGRVGLSVEYDTAPQSVSAGLNYRF